MREFREWGHKLTDWVADYLDAPAARPVVPSVQPNDIVNALPREGPLTGEPMERIFADFERIVMPGITHWNHPGFLAWFANTSAPPAVLAEFLAATLNANGMVWKASPAVTELEAVTLGWMRDWFGLPHDWFGIIHDTASTATHHALAAARAQAAPETRDEGAPRNLIVYCSDQAHSSVEKGAMALGFGRNNVRRIASDAEFRMIPSALADAITKDRAAGLIPTCIIATIGTTSTASIDPVPEIAEIAAREKVWLHVDAAYAGSAAVAPEFAWLLKGAERADSLVFNPHKWLMVPVDCSVLYVRDRATLRHAFSLIREYLVTNDSGDNLMDYGVPLGRRFRALKLWFVLRYYGRDGLAQIIRDQIAAAHWLNNKIANDPRFEIMAPCLLSLVCFRMRGNDAASRELMERINRAGRFFLSNTTLNGKYVIRVAIGNMWTTQETIEELWKVIDSEAK